MSGLGGNRRILPVGGLNGTMAVTTRGKESAMRTTVQGLPAAANLAQAILFAQLEILRRLEAQQGRS